MESRSFLLILLLFFFLFLQPLHFQDMATVEATESPPSPLLDNVLKFLELVNRPYTATYNLSDGTIVDCVRIQDQLGLQHPLSKGHEVQIQPTFPPFVDKDRASSANKRTPWQLFHKEFGTCPNGTIPVQRITLEHIKISGWKAENFLRKKSKTGARPTLAPQDEAAGVHKYAVAFQSGTFYGTSADLSIWDPVVATDNDFSLSQIWVLAGSGSQINTVEAGWQVFPAIYGDKLPHLFIYWTADNYSKTGCYNLACSGFVQTNSGVVLGGAITEISTPDNSIVSRTFSTYMDGGGSWWLEIDNEKIGYWPQYLFTQLQAGADVAVFGGEVYITGVQGGGATEMGSHYPPSSGMGTAASECKLGWFDKDLSYHSFESVSLIITDASCYDASMSYNDPEKGTCLLYGGPGCPES